MPLLNQDVEPLIVGETKAYDGDWRRVLGRISGNPTIVASAWNIVGDTSGLTVVGFALDGTGQITSVVLSASQAGRVYTLRNTVTLSDGQVRFRYGLVKTVDETSILY